MDEISMAETVALNRQEYQQGLQALSSYYERMGDHRKLDWVRKELKGLERTPQYKYVGDVIPSADLNANTPIPGADALYMDAERLKQDSGLALGPISFQIIRSENTLQLALDRYTKLIQRYPTSSKIGKAAFQAGHIHDHFKDYETALMYYQRAYQWDSTIATSFPARFKAAYLLDKRLDRKDAAVDLYQEAIAGTEGLRWVEWKKYGIQRVKVLTKTGVAEDY
jgi:tetratricopeptide (TPR) repeat protein